MVVVVVVLNSTESSTSCRKVHFTLTYYYYYHRSLSTDKRLHQFCEQTHRIVEYILLLYEYISILFWLLLLYSYECNIRENITELFISIIIDISIGIYFFSIFIYHSYFSCMNAYSLACSSTMENHRLFDVGCWSQVYVETLRNTCQIYLYVRCLYSAFVILRNTFIYTFFSIHIRI